MYIIKSTQWAERVTPLEKFFMERVIQRCDNIEAITNQHRTTNGYVQLKEIVNLANLSLVRGKTIRTVKVLLDEAKSPLFNQNIANDVIIDKYFNDLKKFIVDYKSEKLAVDNAGFNLGEINILIHKLKIFEAQLDDGYFNALISEIKLIEYKDSAHFHRKAKRVSELIDVLLPYLVFKGYAISALSEVMKSWIDKRFHTTFGKIAPYFNFHKRTYEYVIQINNDNNKDFNLFLQLLAKEVGEIDVKEVSDLIKINPAASVFSDKVIIYKHSDLDPHTHYRTVYDKLIKSFVQTKDRNTLSNFNNFFGLCNWRIPKNGRQFHKLKIHNDPLNVKSRNKTLLSTLKLCSVPLNYKFGDSDMIPIPMNEQLRNSLYYYNLALGSKSIENSLSLLWTSLEALLPYRTHFSDIECVMAFVSKTLSIGAIARDIFAFSRRLTEVNSQNGYPFIDIDVKDLADKNALLRVRKGYEWLTHKDASTRFEILKTHSELLAYEFGRIARPWTDGKIEVFGKRLEVSQQSMAFQLQRIYVHRNQIIHAGNLVNEYTNMWVHLEWYVGKLLGYSIINLELAKKQSTLASLFIDVEADYEYVVSYLSKNSHKSATEIPERIKRILFNYYWQV